MLILAMHQQHAFDLAINNMITAFIKGELHPKKENSAMNYSPRNFLTIGYPSILKTQNYDSLDAENAKL